MIGLMIVILMSYSFVVRVIFVFCGIGEFRDKAYVALRQGSEISAR